MKSLLIKLKNCYGIQELEEELEFKTSNMNLIYAPNGVMKTSLAKTFLKLSKGDEPEEKLFGRKPEYEIRADNEEIEKDQILVIRPFDPEYESRNISTLLVNTEKKTRYDKAYKEIFEAKKKAIAKLNKLSKVKADEIEIKTCKDLGTLNIFESIEKLKNNHQSETNLAEVKYAEVFDEKVLNLLEGEDVATGITEYTERYNELIEKSPIYSKGKFSPANADAISKNLKKENFFEANHKIFLNGHDSPMGDAKELDDTLERAHAEILSDERLKSIHTKILNGVSAVKTFQSALEKTPILSSYLSDQENLKLKLWEGYYSSAKIELDSLLSLYESKKDELSDIEKEAQLEETLWHQAKEIFKARFYVPFDIDIENHKNAILGTTAPNMVFTFPNPDSKPIQFDRGQLNSMDILSVGERRAMYLLYVIFEFLSRLNQDKTTLIIVDDIADSFDYKNKFAIIEYLRELTQESNFRFIVLTHNFDFYRTVQERILYGGAKWNNSYIAQKTGLKISLLKGGNRDVSNPFELWKGQYKQSPAALISMIPFIRNLIEYKDGTKSESYLTLTSMLHIKDNTYELAIEDIIKIFSEVIKDAEIGDKFDSRQTVTSLIFNTADDLCTNARNDEVSLENKIVISIAARLKAEEFMLSRITSSTKISGNQTTALFDIIKKEDKENLLSEEIKTLSQVILMTPENIHLNSFMYEPLMDMSVLHLIDLYKKLESLKPI